MERNLFNNLAQDTVNTVNNVSEEAILTTVAFAQDNLMGLINFILGKNVLTTAIGIMMATQVSAITDAISVSIVTPILNEIIGTNLSNLEKYEYELFGIKFRLGLLISKMISFALVTVIIYYIWKLSEFKFSEETKPVGKVKSPKITIAVK